MNIMNMEHLTKVYTQRKLFDDTGFSLQDGEKVGMIGINGTGKSTLLKMMAGLETCDEGQITRAKNLVVSYLPQIPVFREDATVLSAVMEGIKSNGVDASHLSYLENEAKTMLTRLGVTDFTEQTAHLSGGQRKRLALVAVLVSDAEVLLLDEPTNHLDAEMSAWLEDMLKKRRGAIVMVTHDRYFLDCVTNRMIEIDRGKIYSYETNYSGYLESKSARLDMQNASERKRQSILKKEIAWMQRGAKARSTKQKAHIGRYEALRDQKTPEIEDKIEMNSVYSRLGNTTIELENIEKAYGNLLLIHDFTYFFQKNDRVGFVGANGCGKTTLMRLIIGELQPDAGTITIGQTVKIGYYSQELQQGESASLSVMNPKDRVIDYIKNTAEYVRTTDGLVSASSMLERFLFPPEVQYSQLEKLSGGERRRLNLLRVLMEAPNVLILDEPTNDLDIATLNILEDYLDDYQGIAIVVSHDRYFLDRVVGRVFSFDGNGMISQHEGGYTDYMLSMQQKENDESEESIQNFGKNTEKAVSNKSWKKPAPKTKLSYKEQREYETIEEDIQNLENHLTEMESKMLDAATDFAALNKLTMEQLTLKEELEAKMQRWEYLEELVEQFSQQTKE